MIKDYNYNFGNSDEHNSFTAAVYPKVFDSSISNKDVLVAVSDLMGSGSTKAVHSLSE